MTSAQEQFDLPESPAAVGSVSGGIFPGDASVMVKCDGLLGLNIPFQAHDPADAQTKKEYSSWQEFKTQWRCEQR